MLLGSISEPATLLCLDCTWKYFPLAGKMQEYDNTAVKKCVSDFSTNETEKQNLNIPALVN